jgi:peptide-methionine (R)-S-oxide reductase
MLLEAPILFSLFGKADAKTDGGETPVPIEPLKKPDKEWEKLLPPERYRVLFEEATERPFTSPLNKEKREGLYICAACNLPLFPSDTKFDSGTGWPSFFKPLPGQIGTKTDFKLIFPRTEYHCIRCEGHQGHVFDDGPPPTGQRYCNNGVALQFVPKGEPLPPLQM